MRGKGPAPHEATTTQWYVLQVGSPLERFRGTARQVCAYRGAAQQKHSVLRSYQRVLASIVPTDVQQYAVCMPLKSQ